MFAALLAGSLVLAGRSTATADDTSEELLYFENHVRPLLVEHCYECHGPEAQEAGLRVDGRAAILLGGDSEQPAAVPSDPNASLLVQAVRYEGLEMPPSGKLSDDEIEVITNWVRMGMPWPGADPDAPIRRTYRFSESDRAWWAIAALNEVEVPHSHFMPVAWPINEIDRFIWRRLEEAQLQPTGNATRRTLIRRVTLGLTGLPPTPQEVQAFIDDPDPDAYETLVDRLLDSKAYGEHVARQWLDLVRYADSDGYRADGYRPNAWRYRDYVIASFNDDKPYDQFVREQIAADELYPDDLAAQVGLGYLRHWVYEWNIRDARTQWNTIIEDITDTTADVFLGLGLQCAKCHNHKFDPLLQKDYLRLRAFFEPILPVEPVLCDAEAAFEHQRAMEVWNAKAKELRQRIAEIEQPVRDKYRDVAIDRFPADLQLIARKPVTSRAPHDHQLAYLVQRQVLAEYDRLDNYIKGEPKERLTELRKELRAFEANKPRPLPTYLAVTDVGGDAPPTRWPNRPDSSVEPGIPSLLDPEPMEVPARLGAGTTGRRAALAGWLTSKENVLVPRVIANRIWQHHFGRGLASNASDFGQLGGPPSHPELLDWLAISLRDDGWSLKRLHRRIVLSATYRQSTQNPQHNQYQAIDPQNKLYWRQDTRRLTAEQIRDSLLAVSGRLKDPKGGPGVQPDDPYRSIYLRVKRNSPVALLASFDQPQFFSSNSSRNTTTTAVQSLMMLHSDLMLGFGRELAERVCRSQVADTDRISMAWQLVLGRQPSATELDGAMAFLRAQEVQVASERHSDQMTMEIETSDLPYRDGQAMRVTVDGPELNLFASDDERFDVAEFTVESFFQVRSVAQTGAVRTVAGKWEPSQEKQGWKFGVTGKGSRRKPQTLVLHMVGKRRDGSVGEAALFSDQHIALDTPYYAAAAFRPATETARGNATFYLKDLSNDDAPLETAVVEHDVEGGLDNDAVFAIGRVAGNKASPFDGLIDDIRLVGRALAENEILYTVEQDVPDAIGYWQFEDDPGVMRNSLQKGPDLIASGAKVIQESPREAAWSDLGHALLNSNGFLYVD
ncbi:MAG: DUF1549 domain-containing protein [Planctomycetota bacterium]